MIDTAPGLSLSSSPGADAAPRVGDPAQALRRGSNGADGGASGEAGRAD